MATTVHERTREAIKEFDDAADRLKFVQKAVKYGNGKVSNDILFNTLINTALAHHNVFAQLLSVVLDLLPEESE